MINIEDLILSFKRYEEIDKSNQVRDLRTYHIAELGIGCNPKITKAIGPKTAKTSDWIGSWSVPMP